MEATNRTGRVGVPVSALNSVPWPGRFGRVVIDDLADDPAGTRALTCFAPSEAKRYDTTPEALQAVLEQFDCVVS